MKLHAQIQLYVLGSVSNIMDDILPIKSKSPLFYGVWRKALHFGQYW